MKNCMASGEELLISGFGKFNVKDKNARRGRNPQTGQELILEPRRVITFKPSGILRTKINDSLPFIVQKTISGHFPFLYI
jgi:integration host factor subunit alpha